MEVEIAVNCGNLPQFEFVAAIHRNDPTAADRPLGLHAALKG